MALGNLVHARDDQKEQDELQMRGRYSHEDRERIATLAERFGLHCKTYGRGGNTVTVVSVRALPNYRADLDARPPEEHVVHMDENTKRMLTDVLAKLQFNASRSNTLPLKKLRARGNHTRFVDCDDDAAGTLLTSMDAREDEETRVVKRYRPPAIARKQQQHNRQQQEQQQEQQQDDTEPDDWMDRLEGGDADDDRTRGDTDRHQCALSEEMKARQERWLESGPGARVAEKRRDLPAFKKRQELLRKVRTSQVIVVSGETGCGKTTQLPQFILEDAIGEGRGSQCNIVCTQPRRISAISVAQRVAQERGEEVGESVGYQIRLEARKSAATRLLFCTTGVLLRRLVDDPTLEGVSHVIIDEIHERGMNEDFLLIIVRDILPRRPDLRVVLMSATLNAELFASYFGLCPIEHIPGLTFPVEDNYLEDVLEATKYRVMPANNSGGYYSSGGGNRGFGRGGGGRGGGRSGGRGFASSSRPASFGGVGSAAASLADAEQASSSRTPGMPPPFRPEDFEGYGRDTLTSLANFDGEKLDLDLVAATVQWIHETQGDGAVLVFLTGWDEIQKLHEMLDRSLRTSSSAAKNGMTSARVLPLHGAMPTVNQREIFDRPPIGTRKIVLATNIAETSITIDDVVFVVNSGKAKEKTYDSVNNLACLLPVWTSKASARQRRGRAGRVQEGRCFHLFTRPQHESMEDFQLPELLRTPLAEIVMQIKALGLGEAKAFLSRAPQPPEELAIDNALELLHVIGALDESENLTPLGRHLAALPVDPRVGKMLVMGAIMGCLTPTATIAAGLAHRDPFVMPLQKKELADEEKRRFGNGQFSDHLAVLNAFEAWQRSGKSRDFCHRHFLSYNTLQMMEEMREQFVSLLADIGFVDKALARDLRRRGYIGGALDAHSNDTNFIRAVICAGLFPSIAAIRQKKKRAEFKTKEDGKVAPHPASVLAKEDYFPEGWLVYNEKVMTSGIYLRDASHVPDFALLLFGGNLEDTGPGTIGMLNNYISFTAPDDVVELIYRLRSRLDDLLVMKIEQPSTKVAEAGAELVDATRELLRVNVDQNAAMENMSFWERERRSLRR